MRPWYGLALLAVLATVSIDAATATPAELHRQADFNGVWQVEGSVGTLMPLDHAPLPLTASAATLYQRHRQARAAGDRSWDSASRCIPLGVPRVMTSSAPFEILQEPRFVTMLFQVQRLYRKIYLDAGTPINGDATFMGTSRGHWEGGTLVIETRNFKSGTSLDDAGLPDNAALVVRERLHLERRGVLVDRIQIQDADVFTSPWTTELRFRRLPDDMRLKEDICADRIGHR